MRTDLPAVSEPQINQRVSGPTSRDLSGLDGVLVLVGEKPAAEVLDALPGSRLLKAALRRSRDPKTLIRAQLEDARGTAVVLARLPAEASCFQRLEAARQQAAALLGPEVAKLAVVCLGLDTDTAADATEAALAALLAADAPRPDLRSERRERRPRLVRIRLIGHGRKIDVRSLMAEAEGNALARYLTELPPSHLDPTRYRDLVKRLAAREGWRLEVLDQRSLKRKGCGAFLAVVQGSPRADGCIVKLSYRPAKPLEGGTVALVGKGICFDTGGVNLKPFKGMLDMHGDMQGSAVALGTLLAMTRAGSRRPVDCWLALAENHIDGKAYKSRDVVKACDGTTIEVTHTDAEGRMVLADTLALVRRSRPRLIVDFATLTGACLQALTDRYSGVFSNRTAVYPQLESLGRRCGERVWGFPMDPDFEEGLESDVADVKQCAVANEGDHILAARFLGRFAGDVPWIHMDLSSSDRDGGLGHIATKFTGFGVRYTRRLLEPAELDRLELGG